MSAQVFPCFSGVLGGVRPTLKVRRMKTRWGVCMPGKRQITLNLRLAEKPLAAVEYVVVHEYAHFVHCDHSPAFWAVVARILPDYKARRALLRAVRNGQIDDVFVTRLTQLSRKRSRLRRILVLFQRKGIRVHTTEIALRYDLYRHGLDGVLL